MALDLENIADIEKAKAVAQARQERAEALARKGMRRRATRARIIIGGAILAELRENPSDRAFADRIVAILDDRVFRDQDRDDLRHLLNVPVPEIVASEAGAPLSSDLPDFASLEALATKIPRSVADLDPDFSDVRHLLNRDK